MDDETFDFGLDPGESFEPDDADLEEEFDLSQPHVMTLLGPIEPDDLGFTLFVSDRFRDSWKNDPGSVAADLEMAHYSGLRAVAVLQDAPNSDDAAELLWIAQRSPVHLVVAKLDEILGADQSLRVFRGSDDAELSRQIGEPATRDILDRSILVREPEASMTDVIERLPLMLMEQELAAMDVRTIFLETPMRVLTRQGITQS